MRYILSYILYIIGDIISRTTMRFGYGVGYSVYSKVMNWSLNLDNEHKIWKPVKSRGKRK
jgi:hypothetical protein